MMNYEEFKEYVTKNILNFAPECMKNAKVEIRKVNKNNIVLDAIVLNIGHQACPTMYFENLYKMYLHGISIEKMLSDSFAEIVKHLPTNFDLTDKSRIIYQLVNTKWNREMLKDLPHREFMDMSIIYRYLVDIDERCGQSARITKQFADVLGLSEQELFELAKENTQKILKPTIFNMGLMFGVTNEEAWNGSNAFLNMSLFDNYASIFNSDLYVFPSSIHELIIMPVTMCKEMNISDLRNIVQSVNSEFVNIEDRLSDNVYLFSRKDKIFSILEV